MEAVVAVVAVDAVVAVVAVEAVEAVFDPLLDVEVLPDPPLFG